MHFLGYIDEKENGAIKGGCFPLFCSASHFGVRFQRMGSRADYGIAASWYFGGVSGLLVLDSSRSDSRILLANIHLLGWRG